MKCPACQHENTADTRFCSHCGKSLQIAVKKKSFASKTDTLQAPLDDLSTGTTFSDRYQVIEELGKGGMGKVYKVFDTEIQEKVALKLLKPEIAADEQTITRFRNELKFARKIGHRNVCKMFDLNRSDETYFITMEYVSGEDLKSFINRVGRLPVAKAVIIAEQVCEGLVEAHHQGVVHRDLKPQNIMIDREGNAKIMDFGIARFIRAKGITNAGILIGTPEYLSPEQAETKDVDHRSDIYTLGIILYEMLTGAVPFDGETPLSVAMKHKTEKPKDPRAINPQIPEEMSELILKCMEKDKNKRYQKTEELLSDLRAIRKKLPTTEIRPVKRKSVTSKEITVTFSLRKLLIPALVLLSMAVLTVAVWLLRSPRTVSAVPDDKSSIAVMYFRNNTGDSELEHWRSALTDLLITDLSQSRYVRVLSAERVYNILQELNQLEATTYSADVIREVAQRAGVHYVLVGGYTRAEDSFRVTCSILEASTGELLGSESISGEGEASFYAMVDELTRRIKSRLNITGERLALDQDREVGDITTSSPEALKLYSEGRKLHLAGDYYGSLSEMQKALEIDPEFAMAHRSVAMSYNNLGYKPAKKTALTKAFELRDRVSEKERYLIEADYYRSSEKTHGKAIEAFEKLLKDYPNESTAIANLAGLYSEIEEFEKALVYNQKNFDAGNINMITIYNLADTQLSLGRPDKSIDIISSHLKDHPDQVLLSSVLILAYMTQGKYDRALIELDKIPQDDNKNKEWIFSMRGDILLLKGDLGRAEQEYLKLPEENRTRRQSLSYLNLTKGKFREALAQLEKKPVMSAELGYIYPKAGRFAEGMQIYESEIAAALRDESLLDHIIALHKKGLALLAQDDIKKAEETAFEIRDLVRRTLNKKSMRFFHHLIGLIQLQRNEPEKAVKSLQTAVSLLPHVKDMRRQDHPLFYESLASAYERIGNFERAKKAWNTIIGLKTERLRDGDIYALSFYRLGKILLEEGHQLEASENLQKFLDLWKGADPGRPELEDARTCLSRLL